MTHSAAVSERFPIRYELAARTAPPSRTGAAMNRHRLVLRALAYYWRTNLAVVAGVATAVAVLAGALVVGDSVRGTLRDLALNRLGATDLVVTAPRFVREALAAEIASDPALRIPICPNRSGDRARRTCDGPGERPSRGTGVGVRRGRAILAIPRRRSSSDRRSGSARQPRVGGRDGPRGRRRGSGAPGTPVSNPARIDAQRQGHDRPHAEDHCFTRPRHRAAVRLRSAAAAGRDPGDLHPSSAAADGARDGRAREHAHRVSWSGRLCGGRNDGRPRAPASRSRGSRRRGSQIGDASRLGTRFQSRRTPACSTPNR